MTVTSGSGGLGESIRKGVGMIHGTGEALRGNVLSAVDQASGDRASAIKNKEIANKGVDEWDRGYRGHATSAGVTPADVDADRERLNTTHSTSTNYGPHGSNVANKLDPRYDSDMDHRGTATGSTNVGPHSTNVGNKLDPRFDSDADHRANPASNIGGTAGYNTPSTCLSAQTDGEDERDSTPRYVQEHRGSIGFASGLEAAHKIDPRYDTGGESMKYAGNLPNVHRHRGSIGGASGLEAAEKLDPPEDTVAWDPDHSEPSGSYHQQKPTHQGSVVDTPVFASTFDPYKALSRADTEPMSQYNDRYEGRDPLGATNQFPDSDDETRSRVRQPTGSKDDLHIVNTSNSTCNASIHKDEPHSTANPHKNDFLNLLDPRVDRNAMKRLE